jgi:hypothetical protein
MSHSLLRINVCLLSGLAVAVTGALMASTSSHAAAVVVPYTGSYNENVVPAEDGLPAGDYDTIGGMLDVGEFDLLAGNNIFMGSVWTPGDSSDVFLINIGSNQTLTGASIAFGTNLTPFAPLFASPPPHWVLEESTATPTIFDLAVGSNGLDTTANVVAPVFSRGSGIYSVLLGNGTFGINSGNFSTPVNYTMTFNVEERLSSVPLPAALPLLAAGFGMLGFSSLRKKRNAPKPE